MLTKNLGSLVLGSLVIVALGVACDGSSDDDDDSNAAAGSAGKSSSTAGSGNQSGASNGQAGSGGTSGSRNPGAGNAGLGGEGGADPVPAAGAGGDLQQVGGQAGAGGELSVGGEAGSGGESASCDSVRVGLLGPIDSVSAGLVEVTSEANATAVTLQVDASAGGYLAAATNPYLYLNLASKARVDITDLQADSSLGWDLALKRDNLRSNGGDSGPGSAQVAVLVGADFDTTTAAAATGADFGQDDFVDAASCTPALDGFGKPLTRFDTWYDYAPQTMVLSPAAKVYLVRAANGTSLYKLQITGYYVDISNGAGGTVKKSAVYSLKYQAL